MLQDLLLAAAAINDGRFKGLVECQTGLVDLWGLEFELDELREARDGLIADGRLKSVGSELRLTAEAQVELDERAAASSETEAEALADWREVVRGLRPDVTDADFDCLRSDLGDWLNRVIVRHGVEAALLLYPEDDRAHVLFQKVEALGTEFLPYRTGVVGEVREEALRRFIRQATPAQRAFLAN